jgi:hypothetical protein
MITTARFLFEARGAAMAQRATLSFSCPLAATNRSKRTQSATQHESEDQAMFIG